METPANNRVTLEVFGKVQELNDQIRKLRSERDDMFYIPARAEIIGEMQKHGVKELLLFEKDEATGDWKSFKEAYLFFNEDDYPLFCYELEDPTYRLVRLGIIDGRLRMRLQELVEGPDGNFIPKPENPEWLPFKGSNDFDTLSQLLHFISFAFSPYEYTKAHPELLVLK